MGKVAAANNGEIGGEGNGHFSDEGGGNADGEDGDGNRGCRRRRSSDWRRGGGDRLPFVTSSFVGDARSGDNNDRGGSQREE